MKKLTKMIAAALCGAVAAVSVLPALALAEERTLPSGVPFDRIEKKIDIDLDQYKGDLSEGSTPGVASYAAEIFCGDEVLYKGFIGYIDMENQIPADEESVYEWGSITKTLIWVSILQLWEQGRLDLDADVRQILPEDFFQKLKYDEPITVLDLMEHKGGWGVNTYDISVPEGAPIPSLEEALRSSESPQVYPPGEVCAYSNWGAGAAALTVEKVAGMDFADYVQQNIFQPLGMEHTALRPDLSDSRWVKENRQRSQSYGFNAFSGYRLDGPKIRPIAVYPAGSCTGTIGDLTTYAQALVSDDAPLFQSKSTQEKLFSGSEFFGESDLPCWSCGFSVEQMAVPVFGHNGATKGFTANMLFDPVSKVGMVTMTNQIENNPVEGYFPHLVFGAPKPGDFGKTTDITLKTDSYYLPARTYAEGPYKFLSYLSAMPGSEFSGAKLIGDGLYELTSETGASAIPLGERKLSDGRTAIVAGGAATYLPEKWYLAKLSLLTMFFLTAVGGVFVLLIKGKLRRSGRSEKSAVSAILTVGQVTRLVSMLTLLSMAAVILGSSGYGIPRSVGVCGGVIQMICGAGSIIAAAAAVFGLVKKKGWQKKAGCAVSLLANCTAAASIIFFEMYRF